MCDEEKKGKRVEGKAANTGEGRREQGSRPQGGHVGARKTVQRTSVSEKDLSVVVCE